MAQEISNKSTTKRVAAAGLAVAALAGASYVALKPDSTKEPVYKVSDFFHSLETAKSDGNVYPIRGFKTATYVSYTTNYGKQVHVFDSGESNDWVLLVDVVSTNDGLRLDFVDIAGSAAREVKNEHKAVNLNNYQITR